METKNWNQSIISIDWEQETIFSLKLKSTGKKIGTKNLKKIKTWIKVEAVGVEWGLVRNRGCVFDSFML